ncbi:MAG: hypothetical protein V3T83_05615 [Acidobacteriota bacterium]
MDSESLLAQVSNRCTENIKLDGTGNIGGKNPAPTFKLNDVTVKKCLEINAATGAATQSCTFHNNGSSRVEFIFCNMIELGSGASNVTSDNPCNIGFDNANQKWLCTKDNPTTRSRKPGVHFGCRKVELDPGGILKTGPQTEVNSAFVGKHAKEFQVSYADIFNLRINGSSVPFDEASCTGCFGADKSTNFNSSPAFPPRANATGFWIMSDVPITDPYIRWQDMDGTLHPVEYASLQAVRVIPSGLPAEIPGYERTSPTAQPPLSYSQDLLLWDIHTMSGDTDTPIEVQAWVGENDFDVGITPEPITFLVEADTTPFGTLSFSRSGNVPEGTVVPFSIAIVDPRIPDRQCWEQDGRLVQDTVPPFVEDHSVVFDGRRLWASIRASDETSSPLAANFFYSLDGGQEWLVQPLRPERDPLDAPAQNSFQAAFAVDAQSGQSIQYAFNVQDGLLNETWFGVGEQETVTERGFFAQFGAGSGISSEIVVVNPSSTRTVMGVVRIWDQEGQEIDPATVLVPAAEPSFSLPPLGSVTFITRSQGELAQGSAEILSDAPLSGVIRFNLIGVGVAGVLASQPAKSIIVPARKVVGVLSTGVAIRNTGEAEAFVEFSLRNPAGEEIEGGAAEMFIPARGRRAIFIEELFPEAAIDPFEGTLLVHALEGQIAVTGLEFGLEARIITALPVTAIE